jgi:hypothetical protein
MMLLGYRMLFSELAILLNIILDPEADYVEDDYAREQVETQLFNSVENTRFSVFELNDGAYYLGLRPDICKIHLRPVMTSRQMCIKIQNLSVAFQQELKRSKLFKNTTRKLILYPEPYVITI